MADEARSLAGKRSAFDALVRALRAPAHQSDGRQLLDAAASAVELCAGEISQTGAAALVRLTTLDELAQPHLRRLTHELIDRHAERKTEVPGSWAPGDRFLSALFDAYRAAFEQIEGARMQRGVRIELLVRRIRNAGNLLKWQALSYYQADSALWEDMLGAYLLGRDEGILSRQVTLRAGRNAVTSLEREFARALALGCASLDQLALDGIDIADRVVRYVMPTLVYSESCSQGAAYVLPFRSGERPRRLRPGAKETESGIYFDPTSALELLGELNSVMLKGLVPAALAAGACARERVLAAVHHLRRAWAGVPFARRYRRHPLAGRLRALLGFHDLALELSAQFEGEETAEAWDMFDVSRNGIGILVPAEDCGRIMVGDLIGVQGEDGGTWHIGVVRRIVRSRDGAGIVGMESITRCAVAASMDDGRAPSEAIVFDPVRRGGAIRLAHAASGSAASSEAIFLSQGGRICKLRRLSTVVRGADFEVSSYQVL